MKTEIQKQTERAWKCLEYLNEDELAFTKAFSYSLVIDGVSTYQSLQDSFDYAYRLKQEFFPYPNPEESLTSSEYTLITLFTLLLMIDGE